MLNRLWIEVGTRSSTLYVYYLQTREKTRAGNINTLNLYRHTSLSHDSTNPPVSPPPNACKGISINSRFVNNLMNEIVDEWLGGRIGELTN